MKNFHEFRLRRANIGFTFSWVLAVDNNKSLKNLHEFRWEERTLVPRLYELWQWLKNFHEFQLWTRGMAETHPISTLPRLSIIFPPAQKYTRWKSDGFQTRPHSGMLSALFHFKTLHKSFFRRSTGLSHHIFHPKRKWNIFLQLLRNFDVVLVFS